MMYSCHALVLVSLNPDHTDCSGNKYPDSGYVEAEEYQPNKNILQGLYGIVWGQYKTESWLNTDPKAKWRVVRIEQNDELYCVDSYQNLVKFRAGLVVFSGTREECENHIAKEKPPNMGVFGHRWRPLFESESASEEISELIS